MFLLIIRKETVFGKAGVFERIGFGQACIEWRQQQEVTDGMEGWDKVVPQFLREMLSSLDPKARDAVEELRLREGFPLAVVQAGEEWTHPAWRGRPLTEEALRRVLETAGRGSVHTVLDQLRSGYVTAAGGVRAIDVKRLPTVRNGMLSMWRFVRFVLGYRRSQKRHPQRVAVETSADRCTHCGRCVKLCPTGAIVAGDELRTDAAKCIRCCACVKGCPVGARSYDSPFAPVLSRNFAQRKRNLTLM